MNLEQAVRMAHPTVEPFVSGALRTRLESEA